MINVRARFFLKPYLLTGSTRSLYKKRQYFPNAGISTIGILIKRTNIVFSTTIGKISINVRARFFLKPDTVGVRRALGAPEITQADRPDDTYFLIVFWIFFTLCCYFKNNFYCILVFVRSAYYPYQMHKSG